MSESSLRTVSVMAGRRDDHENASAYVEVSADVDEADGKVGRYVTCGFAGRRRERTIYCNNVTRTRWLRLGERERDDPPEKATTSVPGASTALFYYATPSSSESKLPLISTDSTQI